MFEDLNKDERFIYDLLNEYITDFLTYISYGGNLNKFEFTQQWVLTNYKDYLNDYNKEKEE